MRAVTPYRQAEHLLPPEDQSYVSSLIAARGLAAAAKTLRSSDTTLERLFGLGVKVDTRDRLLARIRELRGEPANTPPPPDSGSLAARISYALERADEAVSDLELVPDDMSRFGAAYAASLAVRSELRQLKELVTSVGGGSR